MRQKNWTKEEEEFLLINYQKFTSEELANLLSRSVGSISSKLYHSDLKKGLSKLSYNDEFFKEPNLLNSYWAGFIAADGDINTRDSKVTLNLSTKDLNHLEQFKKDIVFNGEISNRKDFRTIKNYPAKYYYTSTLRLCHATQLILDLEKNFNIGPCKSLTLLPPPNLNNENTLAYIIGLIDGDGSIMFEKSNRITLSCLGTKEIVEYIKSIINSLNEEIYSDSSNITKLSNKNFWQIKICGKRAFKILEILEKIPVPKLRRKWDKIIDIKQYLNKN